MLKYRPSLDTLNLVFVSDGSEGGEKNIREEEAKRVASELDVNNIEFMGFKDGALQLDAAIATAMQDALQKHKPDTVFFPSTLDFHPDHRAVAANAWQALKGETDITAIAYEITNHGLCNTLIDTTETIDKQFTLLQHYASQTAQVDYESYSRSLNKTRAYSRPKAMNDAEAFYIYLSTKPTLRSVVDRNNALACKGMEIKDTPLVSIIIRTMNRPKRLERALNSVINQLYRNIEVVIVNDSHQPLSIDIDHYQQQLQALQVIEHGQNKGRCHAANSGLDHANGEYCLFLDDDDVIDKNHIQQLSENIYQNPSRKVVACLSV